MAQIWGSGTGGWSNQAMVDKSGALHISISPNTTHATVPVALSGVPVVDISGTFPDIIIGSVTIINNPVPVSGIVNQGTTPWQTSGTSNVLGSVAISTTPVPISGIVNQGTTPWQTSGTSNVLGSVAVSTNPVPISGIVNQGTNPWQVSGTSNVLGSVAITTNPVPVSGPNQNYYHDGTNWQRIRTEKSTHATTTIGYEHHEIHDGSHYFFCDFETLNSGATADFAVTTPNTAKWTHMTFVVAGTSQTEMRIYEGSTVSGGTALIPYNNNRNSPNASTLTIAKNPSVSVAGTVIFGQSRGLGGATPSKANTAGIVSRDKEIILQSGTTYRFEIKSADNSNVVDYCGEWYEHTDATQQF